MTTNILLKFAKKGINLSPDAYWKIKNTKDPISISSDLILKLKSENYTKDDLISVSGEIVDKYINPESKKEKTDESLDEFSKEEKPKSQLDTFTKTEAEETKPVADLTTFTKTEEKPPEVEKETEIEKPVADLTTFTKTEEKIETKEPIEKEEKPKSQLDTFTKTEQKEVEEKTELNTETEKTKKEILTKEKTLPEKEEIKTEQQQKEDEQEAKRKEDYEKNNSSMNLMEIENEEVSQEFKRNLTKPNANFDNFHILKDTTGKSYTSGEVNNLIEYFQSRYEKLSKIIEKHPEMRTHQKISEIAEGQTDLNLILMVNDIKTTKNGHNIVEFEDDTGNITVLFSNKNEDVFNLSQRLIKDEVVGVTADKSRDLAIGNNIIFPGIPRMSPPKSDCGIVFTSDIHIGSVTFLDDAFRKFIKWLNGDFGNEEQREIANNVKYLTIDGDIVDGVGVYPNQDKELEITDINDQYDEAARYLGDLRSDIKVIICPGNHDAARLAEPQPAISEGYAKSLYKLKNVEFISNPGYVDLDGTKVLLYHGRGMDDLAIGVKGFSHARNDLIMEELLNIRHLAPIYGERTSVASEDEDHLVIDDIPNVLHTGHVHINTYKYYKGVHLINSGTFQTQTEYQKIYNIVPTPAQVPILNNGEYKQLKFI